MSGCYLATMKCSHLALLGIATFKRHPEGQVWCSTCKKYQLVESVGKAAEHMAMTETREV